MPSIGTQARREAERLAALWRIVNTPSLRGDDLVLAMLREAAVAMRPGEAFAGTLGHIEGTDYVLDAIAARTGIDAADVAQRFPVGLRFARSEALNVRDLNAGRTQSWADCQALPDLPERTRRSGIRSQITTQFVAAGITHVLSLGTREAASATPFDLEDYAYIELLGSFFARHFELEHAQHALVGAELRVRHHAERLEALWQIANNPTLRGDALILAMLRVAASAIRPAQRFRGQLGRIDDDAVVVVSIGSEASDEDANPERLQIGQRKPLSQTIIPRLARTQAWEDIARLDEPPLAVAALGWRAVISTLFDAAGSHYVLTFASTEPSATPFSEDDLGYIDVLASAFANQLEVSRLEESLSGAEERSRHHADRLEALWQIANNPTLHGEELMFAMLRQAAAGIRPAQHFHGLLGRHEGADTVTIAVGVDPTDEDPRANGIAVGARTPLADTLIPRIGLTRAWEDLTMLPDLSHGLITLGWRAVLSTQFTAGGSLYSLTFASYQAANEPFSSTDLAYLDVLSSSFARQLEVDHLAVSLREEQQLSLQHTERFESLWRIVNSPNLSGEALLLATLHEAARAIRPGQAYVGTLGHLEGSEYVLDATVGDFARPGVEARRFMTVGARIQRSDLLRVRDLEALRTQTWDDCQTLTDLPRLAREAGMRSQISTAFQAGETTYVLTLGSQEVTSRYPFGPEDCAYIELLGSFFGRQIEVEGLQESLRAAELRARKHAERLESLSQIANNPTLHGEELMVAMLRQAAAAIRPGHHFRGYMGRFENEELVTIGIGDEPSQPGSPASPINLGQRTPLSEVLVSHITKTRVFEDLWLEPDRPEIMVQLSWRALISTKFTAAGSQYVLTFASTEPALGPFSPEDSAFLDVLASSFAKQLEVNQLGDSLRDEEERARQHAERLEALWQIANDPALRGEELMLAMLRQGAAAMRPPQRFRGALGRIEGDEIVVIGVGMDPDDNDDGAKRLQVGRRSHVTQTIVPRVGRIESWQDLATHNDYPGAIKYLGWRAVISTQFTSGGSQYLLTFASPEPAATPFLATDTAYLDVLASALAKQLEVDELADSLREQEESSRRHAQRLEALWNVVNDPTLRDAELLAAMLTEAAEAIRPDQVFHGTLWRVAGDDMVIEGLGSRKHFDQEFPARLGAAIPLDQTIVGKVLAEGGGTRSWDDVLASDYATGFARAHKTRAFVITTFTAGGTTWGLSFASHETPHRPLGQQDHAYIGVLASFFANHVQQRWQFERIAYQQSHDVLTGLLNRSQFRSRVRAETRTESRYALILVDIDAFREINESYGYMIGDALLVEVGNALRLRASDDEFVGRIGDDVFGVFIGNPDSKEFVLSRALTFADTFSSGFSTGDRDGKEFIARTAGLGIALAPIDGKTIDEIFSHAGAAMSLAKKRGRGSLIFYEAGMEEDSQRRTVLRNELLEAVAADQFELYYQPHLEISTGKVSGCEALIRWNHPTRGVLLPQHFIPFAEQTGLIANIDSWVMQHALSAANELAATRPGFRLYFNLSGRQAGDPSVIRALVAAARIGVVLANLGVEITESDAMRDIEATRVVCRALRRLNVRIAIDDFGTGYSSLSSLKRLPVDIVKIDRSFISGIMTDPHDEAIADTIISISARFGFEALAEGVEDLGEIDWLRQRPCRYMQGYAISHALPIADFMSWIAEHEARS